jgi:excisionase family DNA binding protein
MPAMTVEATLAQIDQKLDALLGVRGMLLPRYLTQDAAVQLYGVGRDTLNKWCREGRLKKYRPCVGKILFSRQELEDLLRATAE